MAHSMPELHIKIYDEDQNKALIHQCEWDVKKLVRLGGHISITNIPALPLNSVFLSMEDGGFLLDEKLYMTLRTNGLISAANKRNVEEAEDDVDEYALREEVC
jgi:hypothetical protein